MSFERPSYQEILGRGPRGVSFPSPRGSRSFVSSIMDHESMSWMLLNGLRINILALFPMEVCSAMGGK
ncbi:hypothetical protein ES703_99549 [subsurface metagenome]